MSQDHVGLVEGYIYLNHYSGTAGDMTKTVINISGKGYVDLRFSVPTDSSNTLTENTLTIVVDGSYWSGISNTRLDQLPYFSMSSGNLHYRFIIPFNSSVNIVSYANNNQYNTVTFTCQYFLA